MPKSIRQSVTIKAPPHAVYAALMDSRKHTQLTGQPAHIGRKVGSKFSAYGGDLSGTHLRLLKNRKIVQSWRANDWPEGHYSKATFTLKPVKGGTRLTFYQSGVPNAHYAGIKKGWIDYYWKPLKAMLEK
jgi:activator of HSP90 ATPase